MLKRKILLLISELLQKIYYQKISQGIEDFLGRMIYLAEKRPFFLEGLDLWKMPFEVFYTRSILDIDGGGKANLNFKNLKGKDIMVYLERFTNKELCLN